MARGVVSARNTRRRWGNCGWKIIWSGSRKFAAQCYEDGDEGFGKLFRILFGIVNLETSVKCGIGKIKLER